MLDGEKLSRLFPSPCPPPPPPPPPRMDSRDYCGRREGSFRENESGLREISKFNGRTCSRTAGVQGARLSRSFPHFEKPYNGPLSALREDIILSKKENKKIFIRSREDIHTRGGNQLRCVLSYKTLSRRLKKMIRGARCNLDIGVAYVVLAMLEYSPLNLT